MENNSSTNVRKLQDEVQSEIRESLASVGLTMYRVESRSFTSSGLMQWLVRIESFAHFGDTANAADTCFCRDVEVVGLQHVMGSQYNLKLNVDMEAFARGFEQVAAEEAA